MHCYRVPPAGGFAAHRAAWPVSPLWSEVAWYTYVAEGANVPDGWERVTDAPVKAKARRVKG